MGWGDAKQQLFEYLDAPVCRVASLDTPVPFDKGLEQQFLPVVHTAFSNTGQLMHEFFRGNVRAINALTIKDVLYGEIDDPVLEAHDIEDLLSIEQVTFKVFTGNNIADQATELRLLMDRLKKEPDAWQNDQMLNRMVELAKTCGDIRTNELVPTEIVFRHNTFWSSHFGGVYVFIDEDQTTVIGNPKMPICAASDCLGS